MHAAGDRLPGIYLGGLPKNRLREIFLRGATANVEGFCGSNVESALVHSRHGVHDARFTIVKIAVASAKTVND